MQRPLAPSRGNFGAHFCPRCRYDLSASRDASGACCPECGSVFTDAELQRAAQRGANRADRLHLVVFLLPCAMVILTVFLELGAFWTLGMVLPPWLPIAAGLISAYVVSVASLARADDAPWPWLSAVPMAMLVAIFNGIILMIVSSTAVLTVWLISG